MGDDKKKYVSAEEATSDFEKYSENNMDEATAEADRNQEESIPLLKRMDNYIYKNWKAPFFIYFVFAFFIILLDGYLYDFPDFDGLFRKMEEILLVWSPIIIFLVWKRLFHPND